MSVPASGSMGEDEIAVGEDDIDNNQFLTTLLFPLEADSDSLHI